MEEVRATELQKRDQNPQKASGTAHKSVASATLLESPIGRMKEEVKAAEVPKGNQSQQMVNGTAHKSVESVPSVKIRDSDKWEVRKLEELCDFFSDGNWIESKDQSNNGYRLIQTGNVGTGEFRHKAGKERYISESTFHRLRCTEICQGDLLISRLPDPVGRACIVPDVGDRMITAVDCTIVRLKKDLILSKYFNYYAQSENYYKEVRAKITGTTRDRISRKNLGSIPVSYPSLPEQQRIVSILDEAFAAIDQAKANVERNLQNAKELFESELNAIFSSRGEDWEEKRLGECFKLKSGEFLSAKMMVPGPYPVYGGNAASGWHNMFNLAGSNVIIGRVGALCGKARHITEKIWLTDNGFQVVDFQFGFDHLFLTYLLNFLDLRNYARQAAQPVISNSSLKDIIIRFPQDISEQHKIVLQLNTLSTELKELETKYQQKLAALEELKKSILQKAFSGELTEREVEV